MARGQDTLQERGWVGVLYNSGTECAALHNYASGTQKNALNQHKYPGKFQMHNEDVSV